MGKGKLLKGLRAISLEYGISLLSASRLMLEVPCFKIGNTFYCYSDEIEEYLKNKKKDGK